MTQNVHDNALTTLLIKIFHDVHSIIVSFMSFQMAALIRAQRLKLQNQQRVYRFRNQNKIQHQRVKAELLQKVEDGEDLRRHKDIIRLLHSLEKTCRVVHNTQFDHFLQDESRRDQERQVKKNNEA